MTKIPDVNMTSASSDRKREDRLLEHEMHPIVENSTNGDLPKDLHDASTDSSPQDEAADRNLLWKLDLWILPLLSLVFFLASMASFPSNVVVGAQLLTRIQGRSDIANAKIAGLDESFNLSPSDYSNLASLFLVGYTIFQLPGTLLMKFIGPPNQFGGAMVSVSSHVQEMRISV